MARDGSHRNGHRQGRGQNHGPPVPGERQQTLRAALRRELSSGPLTARELSQRVRLPEKEIAAHLEHLDRTLRREGSKLKVQPATCLSCGFTFKERRKLTRPGACPECRSTRIEPPAFHVEEG
jgi:transcriptional regulator